MTWGRQLKSRGHWALAQQVFLKAKELGGEGIQVGASEELAQLSGGGSLADQLEIHSQSFLQQMSSPHLILPMMAGAAVYPIGKTLTLSRMLASGSEAWWQRGLSARLISGTVGLSGEVLAFTGAARGLHMLSAAPGLQGDFSWSQELGWNALTLGLLKGFHFGGMQATLWARGLPELSSKASLSALDRRALAVSSHLSGYLGLMSAHQMQMGMANFSQGHPGNPWIDTLATHLALVLGGRLGRGLAGPAWTRRQRELGQRAQVYQRILSGPKPRPWVPPLDLAMAAMGQSGNGDTPGGRALPGPRHRAHTPAGLKHRIIQDVVKAIPDGWATIKPVHLWLHLETGEVSASRPAVGSAQKMTLVHRQKNPQMGIWQSGWILSEESFKEMVHVLAQNPKNRFGEVVSEAIKALGTTEQGLRMLQQTRKARRQTDPMGSNFLEGQKRPKPKAPIKERRTVPFSEDGSFEAVGSYHTIYGYAKVRPILHPNQATNLNKVFKIQVNSPNMVAPFEPDPEGSVQLWLVPWGNVQQMEQGRIPKHTQMLQLHVDHPVAVKVGDWVEIQETAPWQPRPYSGMVISPHYEGDVKLFALRDFESNTDPAMTFRVSKIREIRDESDRWDSDRVTLLPHQIWTQPERAAETFHPLEVLLTERKFPVKGGDWVQVSGDWGPRAISGVGFSQRMRMRLNLHVLTGFDALADGGESVFRVQGFTQANAGVQGNPILVHHTRWGQEHARPLFVTLDRDLTLREGDWVKLDYLGEAID